MLAMKRLYANFIFRELYDHFGKLGEDAFKHVLEFIGALEKHSAQAYLLIRQNENWYLILLGLCYQTVKVRYFGQTVVGVHRQCRAC